jgi:hypothetical protein
MSVFIVRVAVSVVWLKLPTVYVVLLAIVAELVAVTAAAEFSEIVAAKLCNPLHCTL